MMRKLIQRKVLVSMLFIALTMLGVISYKHLAFELLPNTEYPMLYVMVNEPTQADPKYVEQEAIVPLEGLISGMEGIEKIESRVNPGRGTIIIYLNKQANVKYSYLKLVEKVEGASSVLPDDFRAQVFRADLEQLNNQFMRIQVRGSGGVDRVRNVVEQELKSQLENIDGVAGIELFGGRQKSVEIRFKEDVLESHGLTMGNIRQGIVGGQNEKVFAGEVVEGSRRYYVAAEADYHSIYDIENIVVKPEGPVLLKDVADIFFGVKEEESFSRVNGKEAVTISLAKDAQTNLIALSKQTLDVIDEINEAYKEKDIQLVVEFNSAETMEENLDQIISLALIGGLLALFILWIFLKNIPLVAVVMLSVPVSVYGAFNFFYAADISINILTLVGLALAIGMLIDNSVVVMENIYRVASLGKYKGSESVVRGTTEVWRSVLAATLTTVMVFLPFVFSTNVIFREVARHISVSIVSTLLVSLLVALLLIPMLTNLFLSKVLKYKVNALEKLELHNRLVQYYILLLKATLRRPAVTILSALILFFAVLLISVGLDFVRQQETETGEFSVSVEMSSGSTLSTTDIVVRNLEKQLEDLAEKQDVISQVYDEEAQLTIKLVEDYKKIDGRRLDEIKEDIQQRISRVDGGEITLEQEGGMSRGGGRGFGANPGMGMMNMLGVGTQEEQVVIKGEDYDRMLLVANDIKDYLEDNIENLRSVRVSSAMPRPEVHLNMDNYLMGLYGIRPNNVVAELSTFRPEMASGSVLKVNNEEYDIVMKMTDELEEEENKPKTMDELKQLNVQSNSGALFPLRDFSDITYASGRSEILRVNQEKQIEVNYRFSDEVNNTKVLLESSRLAVDELIASIPVPTDISVEVIHEEDEFGEYKMLAGISLLLIFMILASVFESFSAPVVMLFSVPLAAIGSLLALVFTGHSLLNLNTFIGFLILLGVVVNNGILLIDYSRQLRKDGMRHARALIEAGISRLRPVTITAATTIIAMLPLALGQSEYVGSLGAPFAITVVGGLFFSTLLTLVFIPTFGFGLEKALTWIRSLSLLFKVLIYIVWGLGLYWVVMWSDSMFAIKLLLIVLIIVGVPSTLFFVLSSLKMAKSQLISDAADITITIQSLVKIYGRDTQFVREWKSREKKHQERMLKGGFSGSKVLEGLIWQLPLVAFFIYFTWWYLETGFWQLVFVVIDYLILQWFLNYLANTGVFASRWLHTLKRIVKWGYPGLIAGLLAVSWSGSFGTIIVGALWYVLLLLALTGKRLQVNQVNIERVTGRLAGIRRSYFRLIRTIPFIGKEKIPFKALKSVSLEIKTGMIGLLGPNGAGKTTLMRIVCGILEQSYGKVYINGFDTLEKREELQGLIGYLPQEFGTYENMSAWEFLDYQAILRNILAIDERRSRVEYVLKSVHMWDRKKDKIGAFSGGMKQRIGIAMILLHLPKILVVDEPTAGLDPRERIRFRNLLVELSRERVVLFSTHIIEDISSSCNQVAVMNKGELKYWGVPGEMVKIARDKVWELEVDAAEFEHYNQQLKVVHHMRYGHQIRLRCLASEKPHESAKSVSPVLEDAYIWLLKEERKNQK
jgi:multidrug efflux pump subunit AcrB/ABC-type multidrug transport system ATPase subunit